MLAEGLEPVEVVVRAALAATAPDVLAAEGFLLGTPANIGYLSGAMKFLFDNKFRQAGDAVA
jgi:multimeric flavodoxin WrbA